MEAQSQDVKKQNAEYEQVKADLRTLREDMAKLSKSVADGQKNNFNNFRDEVRRESQEAMDYARGAGEKAMHDVEERISERPFLTVIILFLAGLVVGKLLDR
ncbi:YqjD family protein [Marinobacter lacisalsi]|uniref:YqjD family protein n=1 Tax=Marinobacter lacisalsi TaxID=475979 RepID=A0ABV8QDN5_9GAMM